MHTNLFSMTTKLTTCEFSALVSLQNLLRYRTWCIIAPTAMAVYMMKTCWLLLQCNGINKAKITVLQRTGSININILPAKLSWPTIDLPTPLHLLPSSTTLTIPLWPHSLLGLVVMVAHRFRLISRCRVRSPGAPQTYVL